MSLILVDVVKMDVRFETRVNCVCPRCNLEFEDEVEVETDIDPSSF